jgi:glutamate N-acetyltransferase/amino-acid N-acetyltransferase
MKKSIVKIQTLEHSSGLVDVTGFACGSAASDIRQNHTERLDLTVIYSEKPCTAAGVFTINAAAAAPVRVSQSALSKASVFHGIVANSGNANAATGVRGLRDAKMMQATVAKALKVSSDAIAVCSTGRIGRHLPMHAVTGGIKKAIALLSTDPKNGIDSANAILTSDTREKTITVRVDVDGQIFTIAGIAKGAGMIQPNMATMLAFVATDVAIGNRLLAKLLKQVVDDSFNAITIDGDMSTNDTVLLLANGASGVKISLTGSLLKAFEEALKIVCQTLADKIVSDGEKISKVVELQINGGKNRKEAEAVARAVGNSLLVKSSWCGEDPNWGRLLDAAGYAGVAFSPDKIVIEYQALDGKPVTAYAGGKVHERNIQRWKEIVSEKRFRILIDLKRGKATYRLLATDLTEGYVNYNKSE